MTLPLVITAGGRSSRHSAEASVDLPEPLSPARPTISPGARSRFDMVDGLDVTADVR